MDASQSLPARPLAALPKAHLHLHLVGSMRPATLRDLAAREGSAVPRALATGLAEGPVGWARFDELYSAAKDLVRRPGDLVRLVRELAEDEAAAGSGWVEVTANPALYQGRFGPPAAVLELLLDAAQAATARTGVGIGWVVSADRRHPDQAPSLARLARRYVDRGVVGFGLANDERANPAAPFAEAFRLASVGGLRAVPHAGELCGPQAVAHAVDQLGATRVGHGVRAVEDPALLERLAAAGTHFEICPTSNLALGVYAMAGEHPLPQLLAAGCSVSLGADDPLLFGTGLVGQYALAREELGLGDDVLAELARSSWRASCAPSDRVRAGTAAIDAWEGRTAALAA